MKILFVLTYLFNRGGDSNHAFALGDSLTALGHKVFYFGMQDPNNFAHLPGPFAPRVDYQELRSKRGVKSALLALSSIYSKKARKAAKAYIEEHGPFDIAHIHSTHHQLTLSVLSALSAAKLPIVWTLHDYKLICPNTTLFNDSTGLRCDSRGQQAPFCVAKGKCKKASTAASFLTAVESWFNLKGGFYNRPECFISPSWFLRSLIAESGVTQRPVLVIPNFSPHIPDSKALPIGRDFLFVGRLSKGKGLDILVNAFSRVYGSVKGKLVIVGAGPSEIQDRRLAESLLPPDRYEFTGHLISSEAIAACYHKARCMILPSVWYENMPLSILEAFSHARPVIASDIGGIPEIVIDGVTGSLCHPGSVDDFKQKLLFYENDASIAATHGVNGWHRIHEIFSKDKYMEKITQVYEKAITGSYRG